MPLTDALLPRVEAVRLGDPADTATAMGPMIDRQIEAGTTGLVPVGTTGEVATLDPEEAEALIARTVACAAGRVQVLAGAGVNDTRKAVKAAPRAEAAGADGVLMVTPC